MLARDRSLHTSAHLLCISLERLGTAMGWRERDRMLSDSTPSYLPPGPTVHPWAYCALGAVLSAFRHS